MYMLNTATIQGQKLSLVEEVEIASRCGYQAIEPWIRELDQYVKAGGNLKDLGKRIADNGLTVESSIGFAEWIVDDDARRKKGLEEARRDMDMVRQIGGKRMAAPPAGATDRTDISLSTIAERYRDLFDAGAKIGVTPIVEFWGFSKTLSLLGEAMMVAVDSDRAGACVLADIYHLYKGGSGFTGLRLVGAPRCRSFTSTIIRRRRRARKSPTPSASIPATAWRPGRRYSATFTRSASTASYRWNSSTTSTGNTTRFSWPAPALEKLKAVAHASLETKP